MTAVTGRHLYNLTTNIPSNDPTFYGYNFTRWIIGVSYHPVHRRPLRSTRRSRSWPTTGSTTTGQQPAVFTVNIEPTDGSHRRPRQPDRLTRSRHPSATLNNPQPRNHARPAPASSISRRHRHVPASSSTAAGCTRSTGRDGPANAVHGNFRYNGLEPGPNSVGHGRGLRRLRPGELVPGDPERRRPGDDPLVPPAGDHPASTHANRTINDWGRPNATDRPAPLWADSASRILRPCQADGHDATTFPDLIPDPTTGKITYDVDNDGDGITDSVWLDLGYPARRDCAGPALQAAVRLHGHRLERPDPAQHRRQPGRHGRGDRRYSHAQLHRRRRRGAHSHLGNSVSEIDPTYALQNGFDPRPAIVDRRLRHSQLGIVRHRHDLASTPRSDNAGIDVRLTQLRNLLAGTRPQQPDTGHRRTNGDTNFVCDRPGWHGDRSRYSCPTASRTPTTDAVI